MAEVAKALAEVAEAPEAAEAALRLAMKMWKNRCPWANNLQLVDFPDLCSLPFGYHCWYDTPSDHPNGVIPDADIPNKKSVKDMKPLKHGGFNCQTSTNKDSVIIQFWPVNGAWAI